MDYSMTLEPGQYGTKGVDIPEAPTTQPQPLVFVLDLPDNLLRSGDEVQICSSDRVVHSTVTVP